MATTRRTSRPSYLQPLIAVVIIVTILYVAKPIIVPLALALLLTFVLSPVVSAIQRRGLPRVPAVLLTAIFAFVLIGFVGWMVGAQVHSLARELPTHRKEIDAKIADLRGSGEGVFSKLLEMLREIGKGEGQVDAAGKTTPKEKVVLAQQAQASSFEQLAAVAGPVVEPLAQAGLIVILVIFMLVNREDLRNRVIGLLGHGRLTGTTRVLVDSAQRVSRFLLTQLLINIGFGVLFTLGLFCLGVPYAFLWGFLSVILRFVPFIGSSVALAFPLILAFAVAPTWTQPVLVLALFAALEFVTMNVIEPLLFGHGTGVTPIALLIAAAFWTWIWGPVGLVLSTPLTVCLVVLGQNVPQFRFFALLLGDKPALQPHVRYYQRLLSRDEAEAKEIAVEHAKQYGDDKLYDDLLLPALALARRDRKHAGLSVEDEEFIFRATRDILDFVSDRPPTTSASPPAGTVADDAVLPKSRIETHQPEGLLVLGCSAHHEAEELSVSMLAHLLKPDNCQVDAVSTKELPAEIESRIDAENPSIVFLAILPPGGLVQARYLCKRLRKRFKNLPIVVGYWGDERRYDSVLAHLRSVGASYVTTSLLQARSQILAIVSPPAKGCLPPPAPYSSPIPVRSATEDANASKGDEYGCH